VVLSKAGDLGHAQGAESCSAKSYWFYFMAADFVVWKPFSAFADLDFDENNSKLCLERKEIPYPLSIHLIRGLKKMQLKNQ
jgi:hypothetical protein